jgi:hypothetical protein
MRCIKDVKRSFLLYNICYIVNPLSSSGCPSLLEMSILFYMNRKGVEH